MTERHTLRSLRDGCRLDRCEHEGCETACRQGSTLCWPHHRAAHTLTHWCTIIHTRQLALL